LTSIDFALDQRETRVFSPGLCNNLSMRLRRNRHIAAAEELRRGTLPLFLKGGITSHPLQYLDFFKQGLQSCPVLRGRSPFLHRPDSTADTVPMGFFYRERSHHGHRRCKSSCGPRGFKNLTFSEQGSELWEVARSCGQGRLQERPLPRGLLPGWCDQLRPRLPGQLPARGAGRSLAEMRKWR
jgi:hypothetical protein